MKRNAPSPVQFTPDEYARAMQRQQDRRWALGCFVLIAALLLCLAVGLLSDAARGLSFSAPPAQPPAKTLVAPQSP
jgi:hypothetical protein